MKALTYQQRLLPHGDARDTEVNNVLVYNRLYPGPDRLVKSPSLLPGGAMMDWDGWAV